MVESKNQTTEENSAVANSQPEELKGDKQSKRGGNRKMRDDELVINTSEQIEIVTSFDQLGIPEQLLRGKHLFFEEA